jgi:LPS sulfotransferase NodH
VKQAPRRAPQIDRSDVQRSAVLYSNLRSGSNLFRITIGAVGRIFVPEEIFNPVYRSPNALLFNAYLEQPGTDLQGFLLEPEKNLPAYFQAFFADAPRDAPVLIDLKYSQAYALGVDYDVHVPVILKVLVNWQFPIIHLVRRDVVAQAISHLVALRTGKYLQIAGREDAKTADNKEKFWLDPAEVLRVARAGDWAARAAQRHLDVLGARQMRILYEDIIGPAAISHYRRCLRFLDIYREIPQGYAPRIVRQNSSRLVVNIEEIMEYVMAHAPELIHSYQHAS